MCLSAGHKTTKNILERKAFTVSIADAAHVVECDYVGVVSANDVPDKLAPIAFAPINSAYHKLDEKVGSAFQDGPRLK